MILVLGSVAIQKGKITQALAVSQEHVMRSRTEPGCIAHAVHQDCENPNRLVFIEEWEDQASLQRHFKVSESGAFVKALAAMAVEPPSMAIYEATQVRV